MTLLESDLERIIMESSPNKLRDRGLMCYLENKKNQVRIGNYGIADIIGICRGCQENGYKPRITIFELKKDELSVSAFFQAVRYLKGVMRWLDKAKYRSLQDYEFEIILIGNGIPKSDLIYLPDVFFFSENISVRIFSYGYDIDGVSFFELEGYYLNEEGF